RQKWSWAVTAPPPPLTSGLVKNPLSGRCLNVKANDATPGQRLQIYDCLDVQNERFSFTPAGELRTFDNSRCIQPQNAQLLSGNQAVIALCNGQPIQQW